MLNENCTMPNYYCTPLVCPVYFEGECHGFDKQSCEVCPFRNKATFTCQLNRHISVYGQKSCVIGYTTSEIQAKLTGRK